MELFAHTDLINDDGTFIKLRAALASALATALLLAGSPALATGGNVGGSGNEYHLNDGWSAKANVSFTLGGAADQVFTGDWNKDGKDTLMFRSGTTFTYRNANSAGSMNGKFSFGKTSDVVLVDDGNGDGIDTPTLRRGNTYYISNDLKGTVHQTISYGRASDVVLVDDWNGDGKDTFAVRRGISCYISNTIKSGNADVVQNYGRADDAVLIGDWNGDGKDTLGVRRGAPAAPQPAPEPAPQPAPTKPRVPGLASGQCPKSHPIKGNANSGIYHVPGGAFYTRTKAEYCFATEKAARDAGFRKSKV